LIKLFALDVDGTLTDGGVYMDGSGSEYKRFDIRDGYGIVMLMEAGVKVVLISGRYSPATRQRADDLRVTSCINGTADKLTDLVRVARELGVARSEIAFAGDDLPDLECVRWAGLGMAVADAVSEIKAAAGWVSSKPGGRGAVRECAEYILEVNGGRI